MYITCPSCLYDHSGLDNVCLAFSLGDLFIPSCHNYLNKPDLKTASPFMIRCEMRKERLQTSWNLPVRSHMGDWGGGLDLLVVSSLLTKPPEWPEQRFLSVLTTKIELDHKKQYLIQLWELYPNFWNVNSYLFRKCLDLKLTLIDNLQICIQVLHSKVSNHNIYDFTIIARRTHINAAISSGEG